MPKKIILLLLSCLCLFQISYGQKGILQWLKVRNDTNYVEDLTNELTARLYGSRKFTYYNVVDGTSGKAIRYHPNSPFNIGIGANYKFLGLNLGFNLPGINNHKDPIYGKTHYLDLQSHLYLRRIVVDFYGQYYKGYYVSDPADVFKNYQPADAPYIRSDLYNLDLGLNAQYIFNDRRFSYRAIYLQNEYQKKSAGSFLAGGNFFILRVKADSSIIPANITTDFLWKNIPYNGTNIISAAVNGGYAYTLVMGRHYFIAGSFSTSLGINHSILRLDDGTSLQKWSPELDNTIRASFGYNSREYYVGLQYVDIITRSPSPVKYGTQVFGTGNLRINLVKRFRVKKKLLQSIVNAN